MASSAKQNRRRLPRPGAWRQRRHRGRAARGTGKAVRPDQNHRTRRRAARGRGARRVDQLRRDVPLHLGERLGLVAARQRQYEREQPRQLRDTGRSRSSITTPPEPPTTRCRRTWTTAWRSPRATTAARFADGRLARSKTTARGGVLDVPRHPLGTVRLRQPGQPATRTSATATTAHRTSATACDMGNTHALACVAT